MTTPRRPSGHQSAAACAQLQQAHAGRRESLARRIAKAYAAVAGVTGSSGSAVAARVEALAVVRESDAHGGRLFESALGRAFAPADGVADAPEAALSAGVSPLAFPRAFGAEVITHMGATALLFRAEQALVLYSTWPADMAPAAARQDHAAFADILVGLIEAARPKVVRMPDMRLVGRREGHNRVADALVRRTDKLVCDGVAGIDTSSEVGRLMLAVVTMMAATERDLIARRMAAARLVAGVGGRSHTDGLRDAPGAAAGRSRGRRRRAAVDASGGQPTPARDRRRADAADGTATGAGRC